MATGPRDGFAKRLRESENALGVSATTKTDRVALQRRLEALEIAAGLTPNPKGGWDARMKDIEAAILP